MKKPFLFLVFLFFTIIGLSLMQVVVSNSYSTTGIFLEQIDKEVTIYKEENAKIKEKLLISSSYTQISSQASILGFVESKSEVYLNTPLPLAVKP